MSLRRAETRPTGIVNDPWEPSEKAQSVTQSVGVEGAARQLVLEPEESADVS